MRTLERLRRDRAIEGIHALRRNEVILWAILTPHKAAHFPPLLSETIPSPFHTRGKGRQRK